MAGSKADLLSRTPLFKSLAAEHLSSLAGRAVLRAMQAGEVLFQRGDPGTTMLVILAGQVRITLPSHDGREQVLRMLQSGDVLGEMALLDGRGRSAGAVAETKGQLLVVERSDMMDAMRHQPELALAILTTLSERLRTTSLLLESMTFHDAAGRLATILLMLAHAAPGHRINITQGALGERIGATRETVNRKLRDWQAEGVIALTPGRVTLLDPAALRRHLPPTDMLDDELPAL